VSDDTSNTVITEPVMIFPNGEVTLDWTRVVRYTANDVPVQAIVEAVRVAAEAEGVEVVQPDDNAGLWDMTKPDEYVWQLLDAQVSTVRERVLDVLREDGADIDEDEATVESVQEA
jgi:hypothetical protein